MIVLDGASLTPADVAAVARGGGPVELAPEARERNASAREAIAAWVERGQALYGATSGVGALRDRAVTEDEREQLQWNLLRSHAVSAGAPLSTELVRAGMLVRANQLGAGGAGVAPDLLDALIAALNAGVTPFTRELGSLGTGDLAGLAEIALALLGEGRVWSSGQVLDAAPPQQPIRLGLRDALGFMSSNAITAGSGALLCVDCRALRETSLAVAALSFEAVHADPVVFDERAAAARAAPGQAEVSERMRALLAGASTDRGAADRPVQDPYPFRVMPQVEGLTATAVRRLEQVVIRECNGRTENALIVDGEALPNGNFHAAELGAALDSLRAALAQSASLIAARTSALLDPRLSGLPPFLAHRPGLDSGVMMLEYTAHAAAAEARSLAGAMAMQTIWASLGIESHASLAATAGRHTKSVLEAIRMLIATELVVAMRALELAGRTPSGVATRALHEAARNALPSGLEDREFGQDVEAALVFLASVETITSAPPRRTDPL
jgi:histidine ammonia-lyase